MNIWFCEVYQEGDWEPVQELGYFHGPSNAMLDLEAFLVEGDPDFEWVDVWVQDPENNHSVWYRSFRTGGEEIEVRVVKLEPNKG